MVLYRILCLSAVLLSSSLYAQQASHPAVENWRRNLNETKGQSNISNIHAMVSQIEADVQTTFYDNDYA